VFVAGGHNDRRYVPSQSASASDRVLDTLHRALPNTIIVVIGPIWQDGSPATNILLLRDHLRRKAAAIGALFIDPIRDGWFSGASHRFIGPDGVHPTDAGHRHIAAMVLARLRADRRFAPAGSSTPAPARVVARPVAPTPTPTPAVTGAAESLALCAS
jgi:lysophospholipase L1-like esterase